MERGSYTIAVTLRTPLVGVAGGSVGEAAEASCGVDGDVGEGFRPVVHEAVRHPDGMMITSPGPASTVVSPTVYVPRPP